MIIGVSYSGKRALVLHQGSKKCQISQRRVEKARAYGASRPVRPDEAQSIEDYHASLGLTNKQSKPRNRGRVVGPVASSSGFLEQDLVPISPSTTTSSPPSLVEDALLTPPLSSMELAPPPPPLPFLPAPLSFIPGTRPIAPVILHFAPERPQRGPERSPSLECISSLEYATNLGRSCSPEYSSEIGPILERRPTPIIIEDSSDDEGERTPVKDESAHMPLYAEEPRVPPNMQDAPALPSIEELGRFVLQAGSIGGVTRHWDETPEGQRFLLALKEAHEKTG